MDIDEVARALVPPAAQPQLLAWLGCATVGEVDDRARVSSVCAAAQEWHRAKAMGRFGSPFAGPHSSLLPAWYALGLVGAAIAELVYVPEPPVAPRDLIEAAGAYWAVAPLAVATAADVACATLAVDDAIKAHCSLLDLDAKARTSGSASSDGGIRAAVARDESAMQRSRELLDELDDLREPVVDALTPRVEAFEDMARDRGLDVATYPFRGILGAS